MLAYVRMIFYHVPIVIFVPRKDTGDDEPKNLGKQSVIKASRQRILACTCTIAEASS